MTAIKGFSGKYRFLSNFWPCKVHLFGQEYPSVENAYQAAKTTDAELRNPFMVCSAKEAKRMGKKLELRDGWDTYRLELMERLVREKFSNDYELMCKLIETGDAYLEETNWWHDKFWGVCDGRGLNHLGLILMKIRCELCKDGSPCE